MEKNRVDFIGPLPMTRSGHDAELVVVDRFSEMTHFAPTTTTVDGVGTARLFVDCIFRTHGLPERSLNRELTSEVNSCMN